MFEYNVLGISGKSGSGKDFIGREVLRPLGYRRFALAWPMKMEAVGYGFTYADVHFTKPRAVRDYLQKRGTEEGWMKFGKFYWCQIAEAWMKTIADEYDIHDFYFTDIRFPHEAQFIKGLGGRLIRVEPGDRPLHLVGTSAEIHPSETALDDYTDWDAVIVNNLGRTARAIYADLTIAGVIAARKREYTLAVSGGLL